MYELLATIRARVSGTQLPRSRFVSSNATRFVNGETLVERVGRLDPDVIATVEAAPYFLWPDGIRPAATAPSRSPMAVVVDFHSHRELWWPRRDYRPVAPPSGARFGRSQFVGHTILTQATALSPDRLDIDEQEDLLRQALDGIIDACIRHEPADMMWTRWFERARSALDDGGSGKRIDWVDSLFPASLYTARARRVLASAADASDVFGGMGSWIDWSVCQDFDYGPFTGRLGTAVDRALAAAANHGLLPGATL
ncbi:hypothetical protein [Salininema proteolyticum]|uniref:Uncharacterized protein n=1 Tax=Salininema proteolyticum TaxID=1607685 RepID=A0ABV8U4J4_9ACTN